jgi:LacI family transcriptional regulator
MGATVHEVAKRAGVGSMTVSRVINNHASVSPETRRRVLKALRELDYVPNGLAKSLRRGSTRTLGLVVGDVSNPFFTLIARGVEDAATAAGYSVILCNSDDDPAKEKVYLDVLAHQRIDGLVLTPSRSAPGGVVEWARRFGPVCLIDRAVRGLDGRSAAIDVVRGENVESARALVGHLVEHGHERIAIVNGPLELDTAAARLAGYRQALADAHLPPRPALERHGRFTVDAGREMTLDLLGQRGCPTAIFATNNFLALGTLEAAAERGLSVPEDLAVVTFEDLPHVATVWPFLTVAAQPATAMGHEAARFVLERIEQRRRHDRAEKKAGKKGDGKTEKGEKTAARRAVPEPLPGRELVLPTVLHLRRSCGCQPAGAEARGARREKRA